MTSKYGFVYLWYDKKHKRYYVGSHWGYEDDGYVCSSSWMKKAYKYRPKDFKRRILKRVYTNKVELHEEENRYLSMISVTEIKPTNPQPRYYNLNLTVKNLWHKYDDKVKTIGQKISASKKGKNTGPRDPSVGAAISAAKKGMKFTDEHREKLRQAKLGKKLSPEHREKVLKHLSVINKR